MSNKTIDIQEHKTIEVVYDPNKGIFKVDTDMPMIPTHIVNVILEQSYKEVTKTLKKTKNTLEKVTEDKLYNDNVELAIMMRRWRRVAIVNAILLLLVCITSLWR